MTIQSNKHFARGSDGNLSAEASDLGWRGWPLSFEFEDGGLVDEFFVQGQQVDAEGELQSCTYRSEKTGRTFEVFND